MNIYFDLDGTLADFYSVDNWLTKILENDSSPYREARPLHNFSQLAKLMHKCQKKGIEFSVISWGSKNSTENFLTAVQMKKENGLKLIYHPSIFRKLLLSLMARQKRITKIPILIFCLMMNKQIEKTGKMERLNHSILFRF